MNNYVFLVVAAVVVAAISIGSYLLIAKLAKSRTAKKVNKTFYTEMLEKKDDLCIAAINKLAAHSGMSNCKEILDLNSFNVSEDDAKAAVKAVKATSSMISGTKAVNKAEKKISL